MNSKSVSSVIKQIICVAVIIFLLFSQSVFAASAAEDEQNLQYLQGVVDMIRGNYGGTMTDQQVVQGAIKGMLDSLDPYTTYYTPKEAEAFTSSLSGVYGGIGINMEASGDYIVVTRVFSTSPAEKAGILQGDKIVEADGKSLHKATTDDAVDIIRGLVGTKVKLGILRSGSNTVKYIEVVRGIVRVNPVTYEIRNGIGYIKLEMFNENTNEYISKALAVIDSKGISKIVLDLRDNPGGEVGQAVLLAQKFVPRGLITKLDYKSEKYTDIPYTSNLDKQKYKLAVLVNGMSASASEIVAGAVQDTDAGILIGTKTFGKGKFQQIMPILTPAAYDKYSLQTGSKTVNAYDLQDNFDIYPLKDEIAGYAKMTLGYYYTPNGRMIDGTGLIPDITVPATAPVHDIVVNEIMKLTNTNALSLNGQGIDVYNAEKILKVLGYKIESPDTTLDETTFSAVKAYQKAKNLTSTGSLDAKTQEALNSELSKLVTKYDMQYAIAVRMLN